MIDSNVTIIKVSSFITTSTIMSNMMIFHDSFYIHLIVLGIALSLLGLVYELLEANIPRSKFKIIGDIIKSSFLGGVLTPMFFILIHTYTNYGSDLIYGAALVFAWYSVLIWDKISNLIGLIGDKIIDKIKTIIFKKVDKYE